MMIFTCSVHTSHILYSKEAIRLNLVWMSGLNLSSEILSREPTMKYLALWQRILTEHKMEPALCNIFALVRITLVIPVQTATLERGFFLMLWTKNDWLNRQLQKVT